MRGPERRPERSARRGGRRLFRPVGVLLVALLAAAALTLRSGRLEDLARYRLGRAASAAGYDLTFSQLELGLFPPSLAVDDLSLRAAGRPEAPPLLTAERVEAVLAPFSLLRGVPRAARVEVRRPVVQIPVAPRSEPRGGSAGGRVQKTLRTRLQRLQVTDGTVVLPSGAFPIGGEARGLDVEARAVDGGVRLRFVTDHVEVRLPRGGDWVGRLEGRGVLADDRLRFERLHWASEDGEVEVQGTVGLHGDYDLEGSARLDAQLLERWRPGLPSVHGTLSGRGRVHGKGRALAAEAEFRAPQLHVAGLVAEVVSGRVTWGPEGLRTDVRVAALLGGQVDGSYRAAPVGEGAWEHHLLLRPDGVDLSDLLEAAGVGQLPWSADVAGRVEASWRGGDVGSLGARARLALHSAAGDADRPPYPLAGEVEAEMRGGEVRIVSAELQGEGASIHAAGVLGVGAAEIAFQLRTSRPETFRRAYVEPLLSRFAPGAELPDLAPLEGTLRIEGRTSLLSGDLRGRAVVQGDGVRWGSTSLGSVRGHLELGDGLLRLREVQVDAGPGRLEAEGEVWLDPPHRGRLDVRLRLGDVAVAPLVEQFSGHASPVEGRARGVARLAQHGCGIEGRVSISLAEATLFGAPAGEARAELTIVPGKVQLIEAEAEYGGGLVRAWGTLGFDDEPTLGLHVVARDLRVDALRAGEALPFLAGNVDLEGRLDGPVRRLEVDARVDYHGPPEEEADLGEATLEIQGTLDDLQLRGASPRHRLTLVGGASLGGGLPVRLNLRAEDLDLSLLQRVLDLPLRERFRGSADLRAAVFGPLESPELMRAEARITRLELDANGYGVRNDGPVMFGWSEGVAVLRPSRLVGEGTDVEVRARMDRHAGTGVEAALHGVFDLRLLGALEPRLRLSGSARAAIQVDTRDDAVRYEGRVTVDGARIGYEGLPVSFDAVRAEAEFHGPDLELKSFEATLGGGTVAGSGFVRFDGIVPSELRLEFMGRDSRVAYPKDLDTIADFRLVVEDHDAGYRLSGGVNVIRGIYRLPIGEQGSLLPASTRADVPIAGELDAGGGMRERVVLDIDLDAPHSLFLRGRDVNVEARGALHLGGTLATPEVTGRIIALEGGVVRFRHVRYRVVGGFVDFAEYGELDPFFHLDAETSVRDYAVTLVLDGRLSDFTFELTSYPPLNHDEILVLLLIGKTPEEVAAKGGTQVLGEEMALALSAPLGGGVAHALGLTQVRVEPVDLNGNARLTLVKDVNPDLRVTFSDDFSTAGNQVYRVEYDVTRKLEMIALRDEDGGVGGDFRFTTRGHSYRAPDAEGADAPRVGHVTLEGAPAVLADRLRKKITIKPRRAYRRSAVADSRDRLRMAAVRAGHLQATVDVGEESRDGEVDLVFRMRPGPRYVVRLAEAPAERKLRRSLDQAFRDKLLGSEILREGRATIAAFYRGRGHPDPQVVARLEETAPDLHTLSFEVDPGPRVRVARLLFEGNDAFPETRLRDLMITQEEGRGDRNLLRMDVLEEDLETLRFFYRGQGYADVRISPARIEIDPADRRAEVLVTVFEGPQWRIGGVVFDGNQVFSDEQLLDGLDLEPGQPISRPALDNARTVLRRRYDGAGHDEARVTYAVEGEDPAARQVVFRIEEGPHRRVGGIRVSGNSYTRDKVVWRELEIDEGDNLSRDRLLQAQRRLGRLGIFRSVDVRAAEPASGEDVPVVVEVREAPNILTSFGIGWDTVSGPRGFFQIRNNNFRGRNQTIGAVLAASSIDRRIRFSYLEPRLFSRKIEGLLTGSWSEEDRVSFDERRIAFTVGGTRRVGPYRFLVGYTVEDVSLTNVDLLRLQDRIEDVRLGSITGTVIRDIRDDPFNPREGLYYSLDLRLFAGAFGSERDFMKFFGHMSYFHPVTTRSYWAQGLRIGLQEPFGGSFIPINERFFAGGDSTIRGFARDTVGPKDPVTGSPTGGNALWILNEELHFPIWRNLGGLVFLDLGNVYPTLGSISLRNVREVVGVGVHFRTPIGPLRLEYGRKLDRRPEESAGELYFSIGLAF